MTEIPPTGSVLPGGPDDGSDDDAGWLTALLTDLADDPAAPPSTVSPLSVIAAAKKSAAGPVPDPDTRSETSVGQAAARVDAGADRAGAPGGAGSADGKPAGVPGQEEPVVDLRSRRRRRLLTGLVAAACVFGVGVVVVPLALNGNSAVTSSSADANSAVEAADAGTAESGAAAAASVPPAPDQQAPDNAELAAPAGTAGPPGSDAAGSGTDQAGPGAAGSSPTVDGGPGDAGVLTCWAPLDDAVTADLLAALPAGAFGDADLLVDGCDPAGIAGGVLSGQTPSAGLVVRVTAAEPGACVSIVECTSVDGGYVADTPGGPVAYAYGNGYQVAVGGSSAQAPGGSGLSSTQALAAAQAVLAALT